MITIIPTPKLCDEKDGGVITLIPAIYTNHKDFEDLAKTFAEDYRYPNEYQKMVYRA